MNVKQKLTEILATRSDKLRVVDSALAEWRMKREALLAVIDKVNAAEQVNPALAGSAEVLRRSLARVEKVLHDYEQDRSRFARETLCIGIGGAAGQGKSTFLQAVTGLEETQIPTGDKYFTTAVRSRIENSSENCATADFHSEESFLRTVVKPACDNLGIPAPTNLAEFRTAVFNIPEGERIDAVKEAILRRLTDAQRALPKYEALLTGRCGQKLQLGDLRRYVAYPEDGSMAGEFLAIADMVIRVPFPTTDVAQLRVVDLPGLGEAGRDLAKVQTCGMADVCDITLLVKRATKGSRFAWSQTDTFALDAMGAAVERLDDQTKYTAILANSDDPQWARDCSVEIQRNLKRPFEIVECNARDKQAVCNDTMPRILEFLAKNLPVIDAAILEKLSANAEATREVLRRELDAVRTSVQAVAPIGESGFDFAKRLSESVAGVLSEQKRRTDEHRDGNDKEWDDEVVRIQEHVRQWVNDGCGYGSSEKLHDAIYKEILKKQSQPADVINECRNKFRGEWEEMDLHLDSRIARLLAGTMDALQNVLHDFVPSRNGKDDLASVRAQVRAFADRIDSRHGELGDDAALTALSAPLRRVAEFDLQFRFHLEPMLHATTKLLKANDLPLVSSEKDSEKFHSELVAKLLEAADTYANGMRKSGTGNAAAIERKKKLFAKAISDKAILNDVIDILESSQGAEQSFCPNRIFAAVMGTFIDAFIRSKDSDKAFQIIAREWRSELTPAPDEKARLTNAAAGALAALKM